MTIVQGFDLAYREWFKITWLVGEECPCWPFVLRLASVNKPIALTAAQEQQPLSFFSRSFSRSTRVLTSSVPSQANTSKTTFRLIFRMCLVKCYVFLLFPSQSGILPFVQHKLLLSFSLHILFGCLIQWSGDNFRTLFQVHFFLLSAVCMTVKWTRSGSSSVETHPLFCPCVKFVSPNTQRIRAPTRKGQQKCRNMRSAYDGEAAPPLLLLNSNHGLKKSHFWNKKKEMVLLLPKLVWI